MIEILTIGEILVEIMKPKKGIPLNKIDTFKGPFPVIQTPYCIVKIKKPTYLVDFASGSVYFISAQLKKISFTASNIQISFFIKYLKQLL